MKFAEELFPMGSYPKQQSAGAYINGYLAPNLDIIAEKIIYDMTFLGIISGSDGVGNGKTSLSTTVGAYLTYKINQLHKVKNTFTADNMVFSADDLDKVSFKLPKYSVIVLDESDDLKEHSQKESSMKIKSYFRKCRQLNQILIVITPSFFELPKFYALNRSHFLLNTKFTGKFERGTFDFYGLTNKKLLYLKGKKEWNYDAHKSDFVGEFAGAYYFFPNMPYEKKRYIKKKYDDMVNYNKELEQKLTPAQIVKLTLRESFKNVLTNCPEITIKQLSRGFGISERTGSRWKLQEPSYDSGRKTTNTINTILGGDDVGEENPNET